MNCHTHGGEGGQYQKCDICHTFFFLLWWPPLERLRKYKYRCCVCMAGFKSKTEKHQLFLKYKCVVVYVWSSWVYILSLFVVGGKGETFWLAGETFWFLGICFPQMLIIQTTRGKLYDFEKPQTTSRETLTILKTAGHYEGSFFPS